jgi:hypothetical protein
VRAGGIDLGAQPVNGTGGEEGLCAALPQKRGAPTGRIAQAAGEWHVIAPLFRSTALGGVSFGLLPWAVYLLGVCPSAKHGALVKGPVYRCFFTVNFIFSIENESNMFGHEDSCRRW